VIPRHLAPFISASRNEAEYGRELVVGTWSLIPWFAKTPKLTFPTCNARSEELSAKASYKQPWAQGQRCIIPAEAFFEPCWESGKHIHWRFRPAGGGLWGPAGLWHPWGHKEAGDVFESTRCSRSTPTAARSWDGSSPTPTRSARETCRTSAAS